MEAGRDRISSNRKSNNRDTVEWKGHNQRSKVEISAIQTMSDFRGKYHPARDGQKWHES
jgi:hypothetical protein